MVKKIEKIYQDKKQLWRDKRMVMTNANHTTPIIRAHASREARLLQAELEGMELVMEAMKIGPYKNR